MKKKFGEISSSQKIGGLGGIYTIQQERILARDIKIRLSWIFKLISLKTFFFSFISIFVALLLVGKYNEKKKKRLKNII
jgi:hypothetical protein